MSEKTETPDQEDMADHVRETLENSGICSANPDAAGIRPLYPEVCVAQNGAVIMFSQFRVEEMESPIDSSIKSGIMLTTAELRELIRLLPVWTVLETQQ